jgi:hypothetical protein
MFSPAIQSIKYMLDESLECIAYGGTNRTLDHNDLTNIFREVRDALDRFYTTGDPLTSLDIDALGEIHMLCANTISQFDSPVEAGLMMGMDISTSLLSKSVSYQSPLVNSPCTVTIDTRHCEIDFCGEFDTCLDGPWCDEEEVYRGEDWVQWHRDWIKWRNQKSTTDVSFEF